MSKAHLEVDQTNIGVLNCQKKKRNEEERKEKITKEGTHSGEEDSQNGEGRNFTGGG